MATRGNPVSNKRMEDLKPKFSKCLSVFLQQFLILLWQMLKGFFCSRVSLSTGGGVVCCQIPGVQMADLLAEKK